MKVTLFNADLDSEMPLSYADGGVRAGFPSPAQDYMTESIDLNKSLVSHPATTFYARAVGDSMAGSGIGNGDLLVIDKSLEARDGDIVVAFVDGEFTLKRLRRDGRDDCLWLVPANADYRPIRVTADNDFIIWGVVTYSIRCQRGRSGVGQG